jgi:hypothetical protein
MADTLGSTDYYIVFRNRDDSWSKPVNLGEMDASFLAELRPGPDGPDGK